MIFSRAAGLTGGVFILDESYEFIRSLIVWLWCYDNRYQHAIQQSVVASVSRVMLASNANPRKDRSIC